MFKINLKGAEPAEYLWPEGKPKDQQAKLTIRPFPASRSEVKMRRNAGNDGGDFNLEIVKEGKENKDIYMYCLLKAEGLTDQEGEKLDIDAKISVPMGDGHVKMPVKEFIYDYCFESGLPAFVLQKAKVIEEGVKKRRKKLSEWCEYFFLKEKPVECKTCTGFLQSNPDFGYPTCKGIDIVGTCPGTPLGKVPDPLTAENRQVMKFFGLIQIWVFNGLGSYEISAIKTAFEIYQIPMNIREPLFERLTIVLQSHAHAKNLENSKKKDQN